jgi:hypothetical protein
MRKILAVALIATLAPPIADAREIRRDAMPEAFRGTWAPGGDACKQADALAIVLSAKNYVGPAGSCVIEYVTEIPGRPDPIYSARMSCSGAGAQARIKTVANLIIRREGGGISAGPTFENLVAHRRCDAETPTPKQQ